MTRIEFIKIIEQYFNVNEINFMEKIDCYTNFLREENAKYNLTRLDSEEIIYEKYFFNSLIPFIGLDLNNLAVLDIGSGSGAPGIILKIIFPKMQLAILESHTKKVNFMQALCDKLGFQDVKIYNTRAEEVNPELVGTFDIVTSRAVACLGILVEISSQYLKIGGLLIEPKAASYEAEWNAAQPIIKHLKFTHTATTEFNFNEMHHRIVKLTKTVPTPSSIPRPWREIIKDYKHE